MPFPPTLEVIPENPEVELKERSDETAFELLYFLLQTRQVCILNEDFRDMPCYLLGGGPPIQLPDKGLTNM